jgi:hypothetical protein
MFFRSLKKKRTNASNTREFFKRAMKLLIFFSASTLMEVVAMVVD